MRMAATAVAPGGRLLVVAHDSSNLEHGHGGPQEPDVLYTADDVLADIESVEAVWRRLGGVVERPVAEAGGLREMRWWCCAAPPADLRSVPAGRVCPVCNTSATVLPTGQGTSAKPRLAGLQPSSAVGCI